MNEHEHSEREVLEKLSKTRLEQGYEVNIQPTANQLPAFLQNYQPDAILIKGSEHIIVEVIRKGQPHTGEKIRRLKSLLEGQVGWHLEVVYSGEDVQTVNKVQKNIIQATLSSADSIYNEEPRASILLYWAALEAITRNIFPNQTVKPQSPGRIIEILARNGEITPADAMVLRRQMELRNAFIHGDLDAEIVPRDTSEMRRIVGEIIQRK